MASKMTKSDEVALKAWHGLLGAAKTGWSGAKAGADKLSETVRLHSFKSKVGDKCLFVTKAIDKECKDERVECGNSTDTADSSQECLGKVLKNMRIEHVPAFVSSFSAENRPKVQAKLDAMLK